MTKRIIIVGGGTAGWLAANHLAVELRGEPVEIMLIESDEIGIIGVGEGTVPHIRRSLKKFGIPESELLARCDVTFKQGIRFDGWMSGTDSSYFHPFASPFPNGYDATSCLLSQPDVRFDSVSAAAPLMESGRSPKLISSSEYEGVVDYAYHFDAKKFGELLADNAVSRLGVKRHTATVREVRLSHSGEIESLVAADGKVFTADFFVDCSGFSALLLGGALSIPFMDQSSRIQTDTVLATQQLATPEHIPCFTLAKAHEAGWLWDIPLQSRRGVGFVYSSQSIDRDQAVVALANYCQVVPEDLTYRMLPMRIGYRNAFWSKNCASLGLSQGFVEPLEATSILVTDFSAELLARNIHFGADGMNAAAQYCNRVVRYVWERIIDFVQLHYCISDRRDTDFWRAVTAPSAMSDTLAERLSIWRSRTPLKSDFFSRFDLFDVDNYLYVLYGMKYPTNLKTSTPYEEEFLRQQLVAHQSQAGQWISQLLAHREWLNRFNAAYAAAHAKGQY
ncbi:tryptophan halogenase family protein [Simiduia agarivorans]|uniref:Tryptophan halogenase n=1 Tax=Simiduia agarivorans (strain DSM 21679 / JCM 13881 / BCRC 17597 / SA1) TaxID=1117647 RepID=K4KGG8_SIMAS|nr:tryptophan halogenase family protein [Simiduia agarivorans]AFU98081.1 tryptophan halogenase [Simiduia agarivorans SA1 = DSM 21679]